MSENTTNVCGQIIAQNTEHDVLFTRVGSNYSKICTQPDLPLDLKSLWETKVNPIGNYRNMSIDNIEECLTELNLAFSGRNTVIQDTTSDSASTLCTIQEQGVRNLFLLRCCHPHHDISKDNTFIESSVKTMRVELLVGTACSSEAVIKQQPTQMKSNAVSCDLGLPCMPPKLELTHHEELMLQACGELHKQLGNDSSKQFIGGITTLPLIIVNCPPFSSVYADVLNILLASGADLTRVLFTQVALNSDSIKLWSNLLRYHPCSICVDTWGYYSVFAPPFPSTPFPNDTVLMDGVLQLCAEGRCKQLVLSLAIYCKIQLRAYGGYGYGYLHSTIVPALRDRLRGVAHDQPHSYSSSELESALVRGNAQALLYWRPAPVQHQAAVQTMPCHICGKQFVPGNHFSKFQFDYCSSACLATHRRADWK